MLRNHFNMELSNNKYVCKSCNKKFSTKDLYNKHIILCEFIFSTKKEKKTVCQELEVKPSYEELILIIQQLTIEHFNIKEQLKEIQNKLNTIQTNNIQNKTNNNENKINDNENETNDNKKNNITSIISTSTTLTKKLNNVELIDWLNYNLKPNISFENWKSLSFDYIDEDNFKNINDTNNIIDFILTQITKMYKNNILIPIYGFNFKPNSIYIYSSSSSSWNIFEDNEISKLLSLYITHILKIVSIWYSKNEKQINTNEHLDNIYKNINNKLFKFDYNSSVNIKQFKKTLITILENK
jgi:hypothetical protein